MTREEFEREWGKEPNARDERLVAAIDAVLAQVKPGHLYHLEVAHEPACRRPAGEDCTCVEGPDLELLQLAPPRGNA